MKVLLMTLQNPPPSLEDKGKKHFSKVRPWTEHSLTRTQHDCLVELTPLRLSGCHMPHVSAGHAGRRDALPAERPSQQAHGKPAAGAQVLQSEPLRSLCLWIGSSSSSGS